VSLVLSNSYSRLILVLATISSALGFKIVIISLSKVFKGLIAALLAIIFLGIIIVVLSNF